MEYIVPTGIALIVAVCLGMLAGLGDGDDVWLLILIIAAAVSFILGVIGCIARIGSIVVLGFSTCAAVLGSYTITKKLRWGRWM